jgi:hypothetical protein
VTLCLVAETTPASTAGFIAKITNSTNTAATAPFFTCSDMTAVNKSSALFQYNLDELAGSTRATDRSSRAANGTYQGSMTTSTTPPLACPHDTGGAYVLDGSTSYVSTPTSYVNPTTFSQEVWFKTTVAAGTLINFGNTQTGTSTSFDRVIYLTTAGKLAFGTYAGGTSFHILTSPNVVNNGTWHQVVATLSPTTGTNLYLDGSLAASNATFTTAQNYTGYWRIGNQSLAKQPATVPPAATQWTGSASTGYFTGSMRFAAVYSTVLTAQQVSNHYGAGR